MTISIKSLPCVSTQEADAAYKCMDRNNYDRDACEQYFEVYKECKKAMVRVRNLESQLLLILGHTNYLFLVL